MAGGVTEYRIIIENPEDSEINPAQPPIEGTLKLDKKLNFKQDAKTAGLAVALDVIKNATDIAVQNVGTYTGNSVLQEQVNFGVQLVNDVGMIATRPISGMLSIAMREIANGVNYSLKKQDALIEEEQARFRAGINLHRGRY